MNPAPAALPPVVHPAPPQTATLRRLFLTLFLRGRSSRGLRLKTAPNSVGRKLALALLFYTLFGMVSLSFIGKQVFPLAVSLHSLTFVFLGMFISSSAGEVLFNKEEADILMHRPVSARDLLWSKIRVLLQISFWLAGALNLVGLFVGIYTTDGGILFPLIHIVSTILEALFCTGCIVLAYQLCLRWFGRERLDGLMTTAQVFVAVGAVLSGQILPRLMLRFSAEGLLTFGPKTWWIALFPPGWFAGLDNAVAAQGGPGSWLLAGIGLIATALVLWLAFGKLAENYNTGLQLMGETVSRPRPTGKRRWLEILASLPPLKWFSPVSRAGFILTAAYMFRDRDVKLRVFPGIAPMFVMPFVFMFQNSGHNGQSPNDPFSAGFGAAFSAGFLACIPLIVLDLVQYSQHWQASDIFRAAPMAGPAQLCHGARRAVLYFIAIPAFLILGTIVWFIHHNIAEVALFLPGMILIPIVALVPGALGRGVPLCLPNEEAKSAGRGLKMMGVMILSVLLSLVAIWAYQSGWFWWFLLAEIALAVPVYLALRAKTSRQRWRSID